MLAAPAVPLQPRVVDADAREGERAGATQPPVGVSGGEQRLGAGLGDVGERHPGEVGAEEGRQPFGFLRGETSTGGGDDRGDAVFTLGVAAPRPRAGRKLARLGDQTDFG